MVYYYEKYKVLCNMVTEFVNVYYKCHVFIHFD